MKCEVGHEQRRYQVSERLLHMSWAGVEAETHVHFDVAVAVVTPPRMAAGAATQ